MDKLYTALSSIVYKARDNASGAVLERFIKLISSTMFGNPEYYLDGPGPLIALSGLH